MKRFLLILLPLVSSISFVQARIGETESECQTRYGSVIERRAPANPASDPQACIYSKSGITILVEFKGGKAWRITYRMTGMNDEAVQSLLDAESGNSEWSSAVKAAGQEFRVSSDGQRVAVLSLAKRLEDISTYVFASKDYAKATRSMYEKKLAEVSEIVKQRFANKPMKEL